MYKSRINLDDGFDNGENIIIVIEENETDKKFSWDYDSTNLLLDEYETRLYEFQNPTISNKTLWKEIASVMITSGYQVDEGMLERKMRNMTSTYRKVQDNIKNNQTGVIQWEFYDKFNEIFAEDDDSGDDEDKIISSLFADDTILKSQNYSVVKNEPRLPTSSEDSRKERKFSWDSKSTSFLLDEYERRINEFRNPSIKKKTLWTHMASLMVSKGYQVDADALDRKIRNMKKTFKNIFRHNTKKVQWRYYDQCYRLFVDNKTVTTTEVIPSLFLNVVENMPRHSDYSSIEEETKHDATINDKFVWSREAILLLLEEYEQKRKNSRHRLAKKATFWSEIAATMNMKGFPVDTFTLSKKMKYMKRTFKQIKINYSKKKDTGRRVIHWEYYDKFCELFEKEEDALDSSDDSDESSCESRRPALNFKEKQKKVDLFRKRQLDLEEKRLEEIKKLRLEVAESNRINREKLSILKEYMKNK